MTLGRSKCAADVDIVLEGPRPEAADDSWVRKDQKALALLTLSVKSSQLCYLKGCKTAASAWTKLKEVHEPSGAVRKVSLYKRLLGLRMAEGDDMCAYINTFCGLVDKLSEVDIKLGDEMTVIILLSSLCKTYDNFVIAMETRDNLPTLDVLKVKLLEEGERRSSEANAVSQEQLAFQAKSTGHKKQKDKSAIECFNCGKKGTTGTSAK